jgi:hypothetical protein
MRRSWSGSLLTHANAAAVRRRATHRMPAL